MKYQVYFPNKKTTKLVHRLSILFFCEDKNEWEYRKYLADTRRDRADEFILMTKYIDNIPLKYIATFPKRSEIKILKYLYFVTKKLSSKYNNLFFKSKDFKNICATMNNYLNNYLNNLKKNSNYNNIENFIISLDNNDPDDADKFKNNSVGYSNISNKNYNNYKIHQSEIENKLQRDKLFINKYGLSPLEYQLAIVKQDYLRQMRKCRYLMELQDKSNIVAYLNRNLSYSKMFLNVETPIKGIFEGDKNQQTKSHIINNFNNNDINLLNNNYENKSTSILNNSKSNYNSPVGVFLKNFKSKFNYFNTKSFYRSENNYIVSTKLSLLKSCIKIKKIKLLLNNIDDSLIPMNINNFNEYYTKYNESSKDNLISECTFNIKNNISKIIKSGNDLSKDKSNKQGEYFNFTEIDAFEKSEARKLLNYLNLILRNSLEELAQTSICGFLNFLRKFSPKKLKKLSFVEEYNNIKIIDNKEITPNCKKDSLNIKNSIDCDNEFFCKISSNEINNNNIINNLNRENSKINREMFSDESFTPLFNISLFVNDKNLLKFDERIANYKKTVKNCYSHIINIFNSINNLKCTFVRSLSITPQKILIIDENYPLYAKGLQEIDQIFKEAEEEAEKVKNTYSEFKEVLETSANSWIKAKLGNKSSISTFEDVNVCKKILEYLGSLKKKISTMPTVINLNMFSIKTKSAADKIINKINDITKKLIDDYMYQYTNICIKKLIEESAERIKELEKVPEDFDQYEKLFKTHSNTNSFLKKKNEELGNIEQIFIILDYTYNEVNKKGLRDFLSKWKLPNDVEDAKKKGASTLSEKEFELRDKLTEDKSKLKLDVSNLKYKFEELKSYYSFTDNLKFDNLESDFKTSIYNMFRDFSMKIKEKIQDKNLIKKNMIILHPDKAASIEKGEEDLPDFETIDNINKEFEYYFSLWKTASSLNDSKAKITAPLSNINSLNQNTGISSKNTEEKFEFIEKLYECKKVADDINKKVSNDITVSKLCNQIFEAIKMLETYTWIIINLKSVFLKQEDYDKICGDLGINPKTKEELFQKSLAILKNEYNIDEHRADIEGIKSKATRRAGYFNELKLLNSEYIQLFIEVKKVKEKIRIKNIDDLQLKLDEQTNKMQLILGNQITQNDNRLRTDASTHFEKIKNTQKILEELVKFQSQYWYLQPILDGGEVNKELSGEKAEFDKINVFWQGIIYYLDDPNLSNFIERESSLYSLLLINNENISKLNHKLIKYLNTKRIVFPRFYFVSDEDLMKILAQTKDPTLIQPHLSKCFQGIHRVKFDSKNEIISKMISSDGEEVQFIQDLNVVSEENAGKVEIWLNEIEMLMISTLKLKAYECRNDYNKFINIDNLKRIDWIKENKYPGQIIQIIDQEIWTKEVSSYIERSEEEMINYLKISNNNLKDVVDLIRTDIPKSLSLTLSAIIVISVHNKDIVDKLIKNKISSITDFEWISQMRYEWNNKWNTKLLSDITKHPLKVNMVTSSLNYGFEYLGNITRLVITGLTDRCFKTLFGAYQVKFGGAPEGPAGTGKTESVKDLSKSVGIKCNVFNCTEGINTIAMNKFFKGLCSSGCWCCFDEFNRIDPEVLSVIAQQILTIQDALKLGKDNFIFGEIEHVVLKDTCAINITMNPSYAGRHQLPDNLKSLFRPCAMMVADYYLIAEITLYSFGFREANLIANKVVSSLKLSSEQLSTQAHYDFGMRSLNAILVAAGKLKKSDPDESEDKLALRALLEVNLPKFTSNDIPLFEGIISDLFPTTEKLSVDNSTLENALRLACKELNVQPNSNFIKKCLQLYETMNVRHALMVVGLQGLGKSNIINVLNIAFKKFLSIENPNKYNNVESHILNPKSIFQRDLYGHFHPTSNEWVKGLLQVKMLDLVEKEANIWKWLIFDGPVDTIWIENMNSLLDDNKKLCLDDSSSIPLGYNMNIIFEVDDLRENSLATISRNGMVLCESQTINFTDLLISYTNNLPSIFGSDLKSNEDSLRKYFLNISYHVLMPSLEFYNNNKKELGIVLDPIHLTENFLRVFECFLVNYRTRDQQKEDITLKENEKLVNDKIENMIIYSVIVGVFGSFKKSFYTQIQEFIYSICNSSDISEKYKYLKSVLDYNDNNEDSNNQANNAYKAIIKKWSPRKVASKILDLKDIFEYCYILKENKWRDWPDIEDKFIVKPEYSFSELIIPTSETIKIKKLIQFVSNSKKNILFTGYTGTGKTLTILNTLINNFENDTYTYIKMSFTAQTNTKMTQNFIESKLSKSFRRFSPSKSRKGILFIDDLNMPEKEKFGAQPPIELLRQWLDYGGWYDLLSDNKDFVKVIDMNLVSAMGSIQTGRTVNHRFLRHSIIQFCDSYSLDTMSKIYSTVMDWYFLNNKKIEEHLLKNNSSIKDKIIKSSLNLYINCTNNFKATPAKTHYLFNLRDVGRVFQGLSKSSDESLKDDIDFIKLWCHESQRVYRDRLVDNIDILKFDKILAEVMNTDLRRDYYGLTKNKPILFCNFVPIIPYNTNTEESNKIAKTGLYSEVTNYDLLKSNLLELLEEHNRQAKEKSDIPSVSLVFFPYAIEHLLRISRILSTDNGNALLVGLGGSGRKSLTTLNCSIYNYNYFMLETSGDNNDTGTRDKIKDNLLKEVASKTKETIWIITDAQLNSNTFLEDINSFLNNGEIPNILSPDDVTHIKDTIINNSDISNDKKRDSSDANIMNTFIDMCKKYIHVVLCMSPIGEQFRKRVMKFPSLVNCTSIDWFMPWPEEALTEVASNFLTIKTNKFNNNSETSLESNNNLFGSLLNNIIKICVDMQTRVTIYAEKFKQELKRYYYITPMSYLQLLNLFKDLYFKNYNYIIEEISRYSNGMLILEESEQTSNKMSVLINEELIPKIKEEKAKGIEKANALAILTEKLKIDEEEARQKKENAENAKKLSEEKKEKADTKLQEIQFKREDAENKLSNLKQDDIMKLKKTKPDDYMQEFAKFLCLLMVKPPKPKPKPDPNPKKPPFYDYFSHASANLFNADFLKNLKKFDATNMKAETAEELRNEIKNGNFNPDTKSQVYRNIFDIIECHCEIYFINLEFLPAKETAENADKEAKIAQDALILVEENLAKLQNIQKEKIKEREEIERKINSLEENRIKCQERFKNAQKLISNLSNEKKTWTENITKLSAKKKTLLGDVLISSGIIAYLGAFNKAFRNDIINEWHILIIENSIPITKDSPDLILQNTLSTSYEIDVWKSKKLPNDSFSVDNAIIVSNSARSILLIDPQSQAIEWVYETYKTIEIEKKRNKKNKEKDNKDNNYINGDFCVIKSSTDEYTINSTVLNCLNKGGVLLYENATENLPSSLMPVFKRDFIEDSPGDWVCSFGNNSKVPVNLNFRVYVCTKIPKPHYLPEVCVAFTLVNFTVTEDGLEDQMLNFLVEKEAYDLEIRRKDGVKKMNEYKSELRENEIAILAKLNLYSSKEDKATILDDNDLIAYLESSKQKSDDANNYFIRNQADSVIIQKTRHQLRPVANHVAQLFFTVTDLSNIKPVYQYSLNWFKNIFGLVINKVQLSNIQDKEIKNNSMIEEFTSLLYDKVCLSLFEDDKLVFSFLLFCKISSIKMSSEEKDDFNKEIRFLVTGGSGLEFNIPNPLDNKSNSDNTTTNSIPWLNKMSWNSICELSSMSRTYKDLVDSFTKFNTQWKIALTSDDPFNSDFPDIYGSNSNTPLSLLHKMLLIRIICPDKIIPALKILIESSLGEKYAKPSDFNLTNVYKESKNSTPILFILSPGADPIAIIEKLAKLQGRNWQEDVKKLSLGQGQGETAKNKIHNSIANQKWIILQNCHLAISFMNTLEKEIENLIEDENSNFRLFLTASPSDVIPLSIIQNSIKLTNEPPKGIKQSLLRSFSTFDEKFFEMSNKPQINKIFVFSYCFFHAIVVERKKYGPLGWNIPYEFSIGDLSISLKQMQLFLSIFPEIQWEAMWYMVSEANYGGRVTDPSDRTLINVLFKSICNSNLFEDNFCYSDSEYYPLPPELKYDDMIQYIQKYIPEEDYPSVFGMHSNADITFAINSTNNLFSTVLLTLPRQVVSSSLSKDKNKTAVVLSTEEQVKEKAIVVLKKLPNNFDIDKVRQKYAVSHYECLNSVLQQELMRFNNLLNKLKQVLKNIVDAVNGDAVMDSTLEEIMFNIYDNKVPAQIEKVSYPSLKPFSSWINDLLDKLNFMQKWIDEGIPSTFWISGFFLTNSFLTGILQNYARKNKLPIDELTWDFEVMNQIDKYDINKRPDEGCYLHGFFMEGGSWNIESNEVVEPIPKVLYPSMPYIWFKPIKKENLAKENTYSCPVYRTSKRQGELNTSGQSTNYLISICKYIMLYNIIYLFYN